MVEDIYNRLKNDKYQVVFSWWFDRDIKITSKYVWPGEAKSMVATNAFGIKIV